MGITKRNVVTAIILSIVTFGIYGIYWFIKLTDEMKAAADDREFASGGKALLFTLITCGIYGFYWAYKMGKLSAVASQRYGMPAKDNSTLYVVFQVIGLGLVTYILVQNDLNAMADRQPMGPGYGAPMGGQPMGPNYGAPMGQPAAPNYGQPAAPNYGQPMGQPAAPNYGQQNVPNYGQPAAPYGAPAQQPNVPNYGASQPTQNTANYGQPNSDQTNNPFNQ